MCDKKDQLDCSHSAGICRTGCEFMLNSREGVRSLFYEAVFRRYGFKEARKAAQDWIEELETMD